jgi:hypothetical protein
MSTIKGNEVGGFGTCRRCLNVTYDDTGTDEGQKSNDHVEVVLAINNFLCAVSKISEIVIERRVSTMDLLISAIVRPDPITA